jgi:hypothetical protein
MSSSLQAERGLHISKDKLDGDVHIQTRLLNSHVLGLGHALDSAADRNGGLELSSRGVAAGIEDGITTVTVVGHMRRKGTSAGRGCCRLHRVLGHL